MPADWPQVTIYANGKVAEPPSVFADMALADPPQEQYVPISALLSPGAVEAAARAVHEAGDSVLPWDMSPVRQGTRDARRRADLAARTREDCRTFAEAALRAALEASVGEERRWKIDDDRTLRATRPDGTVVTFDDYLYEGELVGLGEIPEDDEDRDGRPPYGRVQRFPDGLWIVPNTEAQERERTEASLSAATDPHGEEGSTDA